MLRFERFPTKTERDEKEHSPGSSVCKLENSIVVGALCLEKCYFSLVLSFSHFRETPKIIATYKCILNQMIPVFFLIKFKSHLNPKEQINLPAAMNEAVLQVDTIQACEVLYVCTTGLPYSCSFHCSLPSISVVLLSFLPSFLLFCFPFSLYHR